jgi:hypothetical protein
LSDPTAARNDDEENLEVNGSVALRCADEGALMNHEAKNACAIDL